MNENTHNNGLKLLEKLLTKVCSDTISAYIDANMFMFPAGYKLDNQNTRMYLYTWYAIRQRAILSIKKLIELSGKDKITVHSIVKLTTKPDFHLITEEEKKALSADFETLFTSEYAKRVKEFRDAFCHNIPDRDEAMCYYKDFMYIIDDVIYILSSLYRIIFDKEPTFFIEARDIALTLAPEYWEALSKAAGTANNNQTINIRLDQLLSGKF